MVSIIVDANNSFRKKSTNEMRRVIWYHLYDLKNMKNTHGGLLPMEKAKTCNVTKSNTSA